MSCERTSELLPWLLNGTLGEDEERQVRAHLETCDGCREELRRTRLAWSLAEGHLPAEVLVDHALGHPLERARRELVESHLAACSRCRGELELLRQGGEPAAAPSPDHRSASLPRVAVGSGRAFRHLALAAALAAVILGGGWLWTAERFAGERAAWRRQASELLARIEALSGARLNTPVLELLPSTSGAVLRETVTAEDELVNEVPPFGESPEVVLVLLAAGSGCGEGCTVEIRKEGGERLWSAEGLLPNAAGHLTLTLPRRLLPPGRLAIEVSCETAGEPIMRYLVLSV